MRRSAALGGLVALTIATVLAPGLRAQSKPFPVVSVTLDPSCPAIGATGTWTAEVTGAQSLEYRFWLFHQESATWTDLQPYSSQATVDWAPSVPGTYIAQLWARVAGSSAAWDVWSNSLPCVVATPGPVTVTSVTASPEAVMIGYPVTFAASANDGVQPVQYKFWLYDETFAGWSLLQDYSAASTATWTPTHPGRFHVQTWVRSTGSRAAWESWGDSPSVVTLQWLSIETVSSSVPSPVTIAPGLVVTWSADAARGVAPLQYKFWLRDTENDTWAVLQEYSLGNTVAWSPQAAGTYQVQVWARSSGASVSWEAWANSDPFVVQPPDPPTITDVEAVPDTTASVGIPVTWKASAQGGAGPLEYRFWLHDETSDSWSAIQDYGPSNTVTWTPSDPHTFFVRCWVRSVGSSAEWEAWADSRPLDAALGPLSPDWTTVVTDPASGDQTIAWAVDGQATGYRVFRASSRAALLGRLPVADRFDVSAPPLLVNGVDPAEPLYYRVFGLTGPVIGEGGPVAVTTTLSAREFALTPITVDGQVVLPYVSPSLWDINGDGCLDIVGAMGTCDGGFTPYSIDSAGLGGLFSPGRVNRDSRIADFNGDGRADIFTNVYSDARDENSRAILHLGQSTGVFVEDPGVRSLGIGGFGETVVSADFDNDGDVDVFIPHYTHLEDGGHNWLLVNDGAGHFVDRSASAGVASNQPHQPEAAQAIDFDQDGWLDLLVASRLYINNHDLTFSDRSASVRWPARFDEGMKLVDVDLDGDFDLVHHDSNVTRLYLNVDGVFDDGTVIDISPDSDTFGFGLNVCDLNGDGFEDVVVANNNVDYEVPDAPHLLINVGGELRRSLMEPILRDYDDLLVCSDLDHSGLPDVLARWGAALNQYRTLINQGVGPEVIRLRVVGARGERNQQGRVVRVRPSGAAARTLLRSVESGSGLMAQADYDLVVSAPWAGDYEVSVRFADGWFTTTAQPGDELTIYADHRAVSGLH